MGVRMADPPRRRRRDAGRPRTETGAWWASEMTGATCRRIDYWARTGLLGAEHQGLGSGSVRSFTDADLEVLDALRQLADLGCTNEWLGLAAAAVRACRVDPVGERLVVLLDGTVYRHPVDEPVSAAGPLWQVPLRSFTGAET